MEYMFDEIKSTKHDDLIDAAGGGLLERDVWDGGGVTGGVPGLPSQPEQLRRLQVQRRRQVLLVLATHSSWF
jgi:hypothetical protein